MIDQLIAANDTSSSTTASPTPAEISSRPGSSELLAVPAVPSAPTAAVGAVTTPVSSQTSTTLKQRFDTWVQQGYLVKEGDHYALTLKRENGATWINDKPLSSP